MSTCTECKVREHDTCSLTPGCSCCDDTIERDAWDEDDREYRVTIYALREQYEYVVIAESASAAEEAGVNLALRDGWDAGGTVDAVEL